ncbi:MAG: YbjN domain-containing protein [Amphritea sp.]
MPHRKSIFAHKPSGYKGGPTTTARALISIFILGLLALSTTHARAASENEINQAIATLKSAGANLAESYFDQEIKQILKNEGYGSVRVIADGKLRFKANNQVYLLYVHDDGDLHLYFNSVSHSLDYEDINEWNRTTRLSRAYLDSDDDIALETDLLARAGINKNMIVEMVKVFVEISVPQFIDFAREKDSSLNAHRIKNQIYINCCQSIFVHSYPTKAPTQELLNKQHHKDRHTN